MGFGMILPPDEGEIDGKLWWWQHECNIYIYIQYIYAICLWKWTSLEGCFLEVYIWRCRYSSLGQRACFPSESLRGSVFLKQADCHLLNGVSWWSNEQGMTIVDYSFLPYNEKYQVSKLSGRQIKHMYVQKVWRLLRGIQILHWYVSNPENDGIDNHPQLVLNFVGLRVGLWPHYITNRFPYSLRDTFVGGYIFSHAKQ